MGKTILSTSLSRSRGYRNEDAKAKKITMETYWVPGVNNLRQYGRWAFAEFTDVFDMEAGFDKLVQGAVREPEFPDYSDLSFKEMLVAGPSFDDLDLTRNPDNGRDVSFLYDDASEPL